MNKQERRRVYKERVVARDGGKCVVCGAEWRDVHHILDRSLWFDGGYIEENLVCLCGEHHVAAEMCEISCEELRERAGIKKVVLPEGFDVSKRYNKWGEEI